MSRYVLFVVVTSLSLLLVSSNANPVRAQDFRGDRYGGWCGYALIENLPLLENQLTVLAAITPTRSQSSKPNELFQYRYSLDRSKVIIEGCWQAEPSRDLVVSLLAVSVDVDAKAIEDEIRGGVIALPADPDQRAINRAYVDSKLVYSVFAPGDSYEASAASCRAYLAANAKEWEPPEL